MKQLCHCIVFGLLCLVCLETPLAAESLSSSIPITFYGYVKGDLSWTSEPTSLDNYTQWVSVRAADAEAEPHLSMTANQTRLGFRLEGPSETFHSSANVEMDFYGAGGTENKATPRMRHAYMQLDWKDSGWNLLAGQTWDLVSPLYPNTVNFPVAWWAGNIGFRRPQVRVTKTTGGLSTALALARTIGGEASGMPTFQYRAAWSFSGLTERKTTLGVSGMQGDYDKDGTLSSNCVNVDLSVPLTSALGVSGEYWTGENLAAYTGGIGQGLTATGETLQATGFWFMASLALSPRLSCNLGYSQDDPDDKDLAVDARALNSSIWLNGWFTLDRNTKLGLEAGSWSTEYKTATATTSVDALRLQSSLLFSF
ncbi:MAG: hypothetical protein KC518_12065 [Candidatus Cloacimonetes bacterium]|nr:hypothetical protein [Candidatus Cloacimonadota bacterium]